MSRSSLKIAKKSLVDLAAERIREAILTGALKPGARLLETSLAEEIGASRGTIRAALAELQRDGLVTCERFSAWSVAHLDASALWEIYTMRAALESTAARLLAERLTPQDAAAIKTAQRGLAEAEKNGSAARRLEADLTFHRTIVERCGNSLLAESYATILDKIRWVYAVSEEVEPLRIDLVDWHEPLADAICKGEAEKAARLAYTLCMRSLEDDLRDRRLPGTDAAAAS